MLFTVTHGGAGPQVAVLSLESGEQRVLLEGTSARVTQTGHLLFMREDSLWAVPFDAGRLAPLGQPSPVLEGLSFNTRQIGRFDLANNGSLVYAGISDLPAPDGPFIHLKAAQRTKRLFVTASSRFRGRQLSAGGRASH